MELVETGMIEPEPVAGAGGERGADGTRRASASMAYRSARKPLELFSAPNGTYRNGPSSQSNSRVTFSLLSRFVERSCEFFVEGEG